MVEPNDAAAIAERFSLGSDAVLSGPVARGEQGRVWSLQTSAGSWAVKEPFERINESDAREDAGYQDAAYASAIAMPRVIRTRDGDVLADIGNAQVRVYGWVDMAELDVGLDPRQVGSVVAAIHRVRYRGGTPVEPWYVDPVGIDRWDELVSGLAAAAAPFAEQLAASRDELVALEGLLEPPSELQTCHRDLWADNIRGTPGGSVCVIDWENSGLADPSGELALVLFEFAYDDADRARLLYAAYLDAGGPGRVDRRGTFSMVIAQLGHIVERWCRIWLDPVSSDHDRDRASEALDELLRRPLTRTAIVDLLDAIS